jgi:hypothetical protein
MVAADAEARLCHIPGTSSFDTRIRVAVNKQFTKRRAADVVYCSCRCAGADSNARYCKCPTGFQCAKLLEPIDRLGSKELAGSYCIKNGTEFINGQTDPGLACTVTKPDAVAPDAPGDCGLYNGQ